MTKVKYLILGAGPAGLTFGAKLKERGEDSFLILEKENTAGGLCRSMQVDGSDLDIGGGHFLDVRRKAVTDFLFQFMGQDEWLLFDRDSRILFQNMTISHPFEANIWQMDLDHQVSYLMSISEAGCNQGKPAPERFVDWIRWKLGDKIAEDYMLPYNQKMFADELNELGTYWLDKLPSVSFEETLRSCLTRKPYGTQPGHAQFYYPKKYGYGELWLRMAESLKSHLIYNAQAAKIDFQNRTVLTGNGECFQAEKIITTVPWTSFQTIDGMPQELKADILKLKHSAIEVRYVAEVLDTKAHWLYCPDEKLSYHRILVRHNFCQNSKGYWLETRKERVQDDQKGTFRYMNEYAYPLNTIQKPEIMKRLLMFAKENQVYGLGRWGEHNHYNSDLVVELAMKLAEEI